MIGSIKNIGFLSSDYSDTLSDLVFKTKCYFPRLKNIKRLLSDKNILIAGIIVDKDLVKSLNFENVVLNNNVTDIVCIVGYDSEHILLKTMWITETVFLKNEFVKNIKEIWSINIENPEIKINQ